jgi:hypothetical protein
MNSTPTISIEQIERSVLTSNTKKIKELNEPIAIQEDFYRHLEEENFYRELEINRIKSRYREYLTDSLKPISPM